MWIKLKNNLIVTVVTLFLFSFLVACGSPVNKSTAQKYSQQEEDALFKKAEMLFDENRNDEAFQIFEKLAEQGDAKAQNVLGSGYEHGFWGDVDIKKSRFWYKKSADQDYAKGIYNLGGLDFINGNHKQALTFFEKSAILNDPNALNMLGIYYRNGIVFDQNHGKALEYFHKAAQQNNRDAQFNIGQAYYYGEGVEQDYQKAFEWHTKAAKQDYSLAQIQLAEMYYSGKGTNKNVAKAIEIIKPLAELGDAKAQENLQWYLDHPN